MKTTVILAAAAAIVIGGGAFYYVSNLPPPAPPETYTVLHVCEAPFMRQARGDAVVKRDSDGQVFVRTAKGLEKADGEAKFKDLCP